jgi:predicted nucleotidyltransferase
MATEDVKLPQGAIEASCRKNQIRRLALLGSVVRKDFSDECDADVLTPGFLSPYFRQEVMDNAQVSYKNSA